MKFSLNLGQYYSNVDFRRFDPDEIVKRMGLQLGAIEDVISFKERYENIVVAQVISCEKHPDADKLSLCFIDDGGITKNVDRNDQGHVQVVCGAPNVREGMHVAWIPPGAAVPSSFTDEEPFVLEARELRGKVSNGMLASLKELDMGDDHDGILEVLAEDLEREPQVGEPFSNLYGLDDVIIDCENKMFTHRPDCFGNLGIAREVAGIFGEKYQSPDWYLSPPVFSTADDVSLNVSNDIGDLVPRFTVIAMKNVKIAPSPMWMQGFLRRVGIKPINNVVDITNYIMHLTGQPLHAFDYDKLQKYSKEPSLMPRMANKGEKITLLGDKTIELDEKDMVISTDKEAVALAGIMGGMHTEVDDVTQNIVIECANFDMYAIRRTSMRHGLFTDAVTRFNKGQSPLQNLSALHHAVHLFEEYAGAEVSSQLYDLTLFDLQADNLNYVEVSIDFINSRLGTDLSPEHVQSLLQNVEFDVSSQERILQVTAPFWRMDIAIKEDIVEEVGRLYGYHNVPVVLPPRVSKPSKKNPTRDFKQELRSQLVTAGANEVLTYSFVHGDLLKKTGSDPEQTAFHLRNALSPDLQYYRTSLTPSLLAKVRGNIKAQAGKDANEFALFEFGKAHVKGHQEDDDTTLPKQMRRLSLVLAADAKAAKKRGGSAYYQAKKYLDELTNGQATYLPLDTNEYPIVGPYQMKRSAVVTVGGQVLGVVGEIRSSVVQALKLPEYCAAFEIDTDLLQEYLQENAYRKLSTYPTSTQDVTFEVENTVGWGELHALVKAELEVLHAEGYDYTLSALDIFAPEDSEKVRISFRIELAHHEKTMKSSEVTEVINQISEAAAEKLKAVKI
jgi:phenylalanyl-tRNA synthetase beta chain